MLMAIFGAILPRFVLLVGWSNDQAGWQAAVGGPVLLLGGFLFFPWTTLIYGLLLLLAGLIIHDWTHGGRKSSILDR